MKSLIIGAAGFVGTYLVRHLRDDLKQDVYVTKMRNECITESQIHIFDLNILEKDEVDRILKEISPDYIFHLAAQSSVSVSWKNPGLTVDVNVKGALNVLDAVRENVPTAHVLLIGSGEEYGHVQLGEVPITEENRTRPGNIYAATKACQNMIGNIYAKAYDINIMMVRAFNHIGPNQAPLFVVSDFCRQVAEIEAEKKEPVIYVGNLSAKRDFTDVRDVVRAYALLIERGCKGETYNVGSGNAISIEEVLQVILKHAKKRIAVEVDSEKLRPVDVPIIEADIKKINQCTAWRPEIDIEQTILEMLDYWREMV